MYAEHIALRWSANWGDWKELQTFGCAAAKTIALSRKYRNQL